MKKTEIKKLLSSLQRLKRYIYASPKDNVEIGLNVINMGYNQGVDDAMKIVSSTELSQ